MVAFEDTCCAFWKKIFVNDWGAREKLRFDLYYIRHFTPLLDILIILMTVRVALFGIGSR